ncbi:MULTISPECIES: hypothetical protein [unclassified Cohnella]|uniref:hypothetical protein n=1 Tax=unclassified Cohnella TaxID=2636738 RepID=UPI0011805D57|nr:MULTISPECIES: hypothetical protein [unclassified Cohnella]
MESLEASISSASLICSWVKSENPRFSSLILFIQTLNNGLNSQSLRQIGIPVLFAERLLQISDDHNPAGYDLNQIAVLARRLGYDLGYDTFIRRVNGVNNLPLQIPFLFQQRSTGYPQLDIPLPVLIIFVPGWGRRSPTGKSFPFGVCPPSGISSIPNGDFPPEREAVPLWIMNVFADRASFISGYERAWSALGNLDFESEKLLGDNDSFSFEPNASSFDKPVHHPPQLDMVNITYSLK